MPCGVVGHERFPAWLIQASEGVAEQPKVGQLAEINDKRRTNSHIRESRIKDGFAAVGVKVTFKD